jgi:hypothetical protein
LPSLGVPVFTNAGGTNYPHAFKGYMANPIAGYRRYGGIPYGGGVDPFGSAGKLNSGLPAFYVSRADNGFVPEPADLNLYVQRSLGVMLPQIKAGLSLLNSVVELKDFKSLPNLVRRLRELRSVNFVDYGKRTLRALFQTGAETHLTTQFAILPLLSDVLGIARALLTAERRMNRLIAESGKILTRHYTFVWNEFTDEQAWQVDQGYCEDTGLLQTLGRYAAHRTVSYSPSVFHAEIRYNYNYSQYQVEHARLLSILDELGLNFNPAILWNAIPWSFLADWVVGIGRYLDSLKTENMKPTINILGYLWSVKRNRTIRVTRGIETPESGYLDNARIPMPEITETAYRRTVESPSRSSIESSGLSAKEFSLGAALVVAKRLRRTNGL